VTTNASGVWSIDTGTAVPVSGTFTPLPDGTYDVTAATVDSAGNVGTDPTTSELVISSKPVVRIDAMLEGDNRVNAIEDNDVVISGTVLNIEPGQIVTVDLSDSGSPGHSLTATAVVQANGTWTLTGDQVANISTWNNGPITVFANANDLGNNAAPQVTSTLTLDNVAPLLTINTLIEGDNIVNAAEDNDVVIAGTTTAEAGQVVTVVLTSSTNPTQTKTVTAVVAADGSWALSSTQMADISTWANGPVTVTANVSDVAGNPAVQATKTLTLDNSAPTLTINTLIEGDNIVNAAEDNDVVIAGTTTAEAGQVVTVVLTSSTNPTQTKTVTAVVAAGGTWALTDAQMADISTWANGPVAVTANVSDVAGNPAAQATKTLTLDNIAPVVAVNPLTTSDTTPVLTGTATPNAPLTVTVNNVVYSVTADSSGNWSVDTGTKAPVSGTFAPLPDGTYSITATTTDTAGNTAIDATASELVITSKPVVKIDPVLEGDNRVNAAEDNDVVISGTTVNIEPGRTVTVVLTDTVNPTQTKTVTALVQANGTWALTDAQITDISSWANGPVTVTANVSDAGGNAAPQATSTLTLDNSAPTLVIDAVLMGDNRINTAESTAVVISGTTTAEAGQVVSVTLTSVINPAQTVVKTAVVQAGGTWALTGAQIADVSTWTNGGITVVANVSDLAGNAAPQATSNVTLLLDTLPPALTINATLEGDNIVNAAEDNDVVISGTTTAEAGQVVTVVLTNSTNPTQTKTLTAVVAAGGSWALTDAQMLDISTWANGPVAVTANVSDVAGNPAVQASKTLTLDNLAPAKPLITQVKDDVPGLTANLSDGGTTNDNLPTLTITAEPGSTVKVYDNGTLLGTAVEDPTQPGTFTFTPQDPIIDVDRYPGADFDDQRHTGRRQHRQRGRRQRCGHLRHHHGPARPSGHRGADQHAQHRADQDRDRRGGGRWHMGAEQHPDGRYQHLGQWPGGGQSQCERCGRQPCCRSHQDTGARQPGPGCAGDHPGQGRYGGPDRQPDRWRRHQRQAACFDHHGRAWHHRQGVRQRHLAGHGGGRPDPTGYFHLHACHAAGRWSARIHRHVHRCGWQRQPRHRRV
jgi:predicted DNA binding protein